jgi:hypothetical protein
VHVANAPVCDVHPTLQHALSGPQGPLVGRFALRALRAVRQFAWLEVGRAKVALSRPARWLTGEAVSKPTSPHQGASQQVPRKERAGKRHTVGEKERIGTDE